jgi:protein tyrosine phosphatase (PTP) superfamily phosphohydrolase (DUF442 family)
MPERELLAICNYRRLDSRLATAGQPSTEQFAGIGKAFDVVINLALPDSPNAIPNEADMAKRHGLGYIHIPVDFKKPTLDDLQRFFACMAENDGKRVFVHCALNWRVSAFLFLYRVIVQQLPVAQALTEMHAIWTPDATWREFINQALAYYGVDAKYPGSQAPAKEG